MRLPYLAVVVVWLGTTVKVQAQDKVVEVNANPPEIVLRGTNVRHSLLLDGKMDNGRLVDVTHHLKYVSADERIAKVSDSGIVQAVSNGKTSIRVSGLGKSLNIPVTVDGTEQKIAYHFENDITPLLNRFGCNSSGCHGNAEGQNGFKLSVFGSDPTFDYSAIVKEARGRRVLVSSPDFSMLLTKASGSMAHGGGVRIPRGSQEYNTIRGWIAAGMPVGDPKAPRVVSVEVQPTERQLSFKGQQQLRVMAKYSDGKVVDVTHHARFQSNNEALVSVNSFGLVSAGEVPGEAAVMASFMGEVAVFRAFLPRPDVIAEFPKIPEHNFIDALVHRHLQKLNIVPSDVCDDATYMRRVYLDILGTLPAADEARRFLESKDRDRGKLVDALLARPEYADYWALKWADLLRVEKQALGSKRAFGFYRWIRDSFAANKPMDRFTSELITAEGPLDSVGPASFYKVVSKPGEMASSISQIFLGVRIACAECHHHPFDRWSQTDYFGMQAFFTPVAPKTSGKTEYLLATGSPVTTHPRTGEKVHAHALGMTMPKDSPIGDRRIKLAEWMTAPGNPWFARNLANRYWAHFLGRGLVDPVDDVRATNPPSNPVLLDALAKHLVDNRFDAKALIKVIVLSRTYQLSTTPNATNEKDEWNHSRALMRRLDAEVLLDMVSQTTGVEETFTGIPSGTRAVQLWDTKVKHYFLKAFGRPSRMTTCECERVTSPSAGQVLHLLNSPEIHAKLAHEAGTIAKLTRKHADDERLVEEIYLTFCTRFPSTEERKIAMAYLERRSGNRREAAEDLAWTLLNSLEFVFQH